jgi:hypothetical protein
MQKIIRATSLFVILAVAGSASSMTNYDKIRNVIKGTADTLQQPWTYLVPTMLVGAQYDFNKATSPNSPFNLASAVKKALPFSLLGATGTLIKNSLPNYEKRNSLLRTVCDHSYAFTAFGYGLYYSLTKENVDERNIYLGVCLGTGAYLSLIWANNYLGDNKPSEGKAKHQRRDSY